MKNNIYSTSRIDYNPSNGINQSMTSRNKNQNSDKSITNLVINSLNARESNIRDAMEDISLIMGTKYKDMKITSEQKRVMNQLEIIIELINEEKNIIQTN